MPLTFIRNLNEFNSGGVSLWNLDEAAHRINKSGRDPSGIGRWTWTTYQGKYNKILRIIVPYRPCYITSLLKPRAHYSSTTLLSVNNTYAQQKNFLLSHNDERCPRLALLGDLEISLEQWTNTGEELIVLGDFNEDVRSSSLTDRLLRHKGMQEAILEARSHYDTPPTHQRGVKPIDGIWATAGITPTACGY